MKGKGEQRDGGHAQEGARSQAARARRPHGRGEVEEKPEKSGEG